MLAIPVYDYGIRFCDQSFNAECLNPYRNQYVLVEEDQYKAPKKLLVLNNEGIVIGCIPQVVINSRKMRACPFCGSSHTQLDQRLDGTSQVICLECKAAGPMTSGHDAYQRESDAIKRWNAYE